MNTADKLCHKHGRPIGTSNPATPLTQKEIFRLINACDGKHGLRNRAIVTLCLSSGCRIGTAIRLTADQIADKNGNCRPSYIVQSSNEKSRRTHRYWISKHGQQLIQDYLDTLVLIKGNSLFPSPRTGGFMTPSSGSRLIANLMRKAGIDNNSSHGLRKWFGATLYQSHGVGLAELSTLLNHSSVETTKIYVGNLQPNIEKIMTNLKF